MIKRSQNISIKFRKISYIAVFQMNRDLTGRVTLHIMYL